MRKTAPGLRTTIYLAAPAAKVLERVRAEWDKYGIETNISSVFSRLLLGDSIAVVIDRPFRSDLARIAAERERLRNDLKRAIKRPGSNLLGLHREIAGLLPPVMQISATVGRAKRSNGTYSPDLTEALRIKESLSKLLAECAEAIVLGRRR